MTSNLKQLIHWLARPILLHWLLPYLMVMVVVGTVAQKYIGLYDSQRLFFSSFILWEGYIPLPGIRAISALILLSLVVKLIVASPWHKANSGIFIAHLGVLLLLLGGLVTAALSVEGYATLGKNDHTDSFTDYHKRVLTISKNNHDLLIIPWVDIQKNKAITSPLLPFSFKINDACRNCTMALREGNTPNLKGPAQKVQLVPIKHYLEDESNLAGIEFTLSNAGQDADGIYLAFEPMEKQPAFLYHGDSYHITLGREQYHLPFTLQLLESEKEVHPGTDVPRSYRSVVMVIDGKLQQRVVITMNHPLRYKGYTIYQSSFNANADTQQTQNVSYAIVENSGRLFPYIASITLSIGLLIHLCLRLPNLIKRNNDAS